MIHFPDLTARVIACATEVHLETGPGLTKEMYENCLDIELTAAGIPFERGRVLPLIYDGHQLDFSIRTDFIVAGSLLVQVEAVEDLQPIHDQKLSSCLWMGSFPSALMLNFNVADMADGIAGMIPTIPTQEADVPFRDVFDDPAP